MCLCCFPSAYVSKLIEARFTCRCWVADGINEVRATARLFVRLITDEMLFNSITVRLANLRATDFLSRRLDDRVIYDRFVDAIATIVPVTTDKVYVVSVRDDTDVSEQVQTAQIL